MHIFARPRRVAALNEQKGASVETLGVDSRDSSPPLSSSLHSRNFASAAHESSYLRQASILRWTRPLLAVLVAAGGLAVVGCTSHVLQSYDQSALDGRWYLHLWPADLVTAPTLAQLVPAAIATGTALLYLVFAVMPSPRSRLLIENIVFIATSITGAVVSLFAIIYTQIITRHVDADGRDTLLTYTCNLYNNARVFVDNGNTLKLPVSTSSFLPDGFKRLCIESQVARWMVIGLFIVEIFAMGIAIIGLISEIKIRRERESRSHGAEKSSFA